MCSSALLDGMDILNATTGAISLGPILNQNPQLSHCQLGKDGNVRKSLPSHHQKFNHLTIATLKVQQVWWVVAEYSDIIKGGESSSQFQ